MKGQDYRYCGGNMKYTIIIILTIYIVNANGNPKKSRISSEERIDSLFPNINYTVSNNENGFKTTFEEYEYENFYNISMENQDASNTTKDILLLNSNFTDIQILRDMVTTTTERPDCEANTCYKKCCPAGQMYSFMNFNCIPAPKPYNNWTPEFKTLSGVLITIDEPITPVVGMPTCEHYGPSSPGYLLHSGNYYIPKEDKDFDIDSYCIEMIHAPVGNIANFALPCGQEFAVSNIACFKTQEKRTYDKVREYIHPITIMLSCIGLTTIIGCYVFIEELRKKQKNQGPVLISHALALLIGNIMLFMISIPANSIISDRACTAIGITIHYTFLAAFFWLNVMCFDMWSIIRASEDFVRVNVTNKPKILEKKLLWYSLYAWGLPFCIVLVSVIINFLPKDALPCDAIIPEYGIGQCWMPRKKNTLFIYFYGFVAVLFAINIILLIHLGCLLSHLPDKIWKKIQKIFGVAKQDNKNSTKESQHSSNLRKFGNADYKKIFIQRTSIFAVLAVCWVFEVLSLISGPRELWALTDLLNTLQGFFLFLIFISSPQRRRIIIQSIVKSVHVARDSFRNMSLTDSTSVTQFLSNITTTMARRSSREEDWSSSGEVSFNGNSKKIKDAEISDRYEPVQLLSISSTNSDHSK